VITTYNNSRTNNATEATANTSHTDKQAVQSTTSSPRFSHIR